MTGLLVQRASTPVSNSTRTSTLFHTSISWNESTSKRTSPNLKLISAIVGGFGPRLRIATHKKKKKLQKATNSDCRGQNRTKLQDLPSADASSSCSWSRWLLQGCSFSSKSFLPVARLTTIKCRKTWGSQSLASSAEPFCTSTCRTRLYRDSQWWSFHSTTRTSLGHGSGLSLLALPSAWWSFA